MKAKWMWVAVMGLGLMAPMGLAEAPKKDVHARNAAAATSDPSVAAEKKDASGKFIKMHESFLKRREQPMQVLFLGDSITEGWSGRGKAVWEKNYAKCEAANFGIGGDRTEHVLWRIANGELDGIKPKVVVLMIGTNNTGSNTAEQIAAADKKIVSEIRTRLPDSKVLLLGVFPRGPRPAMKGKDGKPAAPVASDDAEKRMGKIKAINAELAGLDDGKAVRYLDITEKFLVGGKIPMDVMPDQLHPNEKGYEIWAAAMNPLLESMMK